jgi:hypothetical protein
MLIPGVTMTLLWITFIKRLFHREKCVFQYNSPMKNSFYPRNKIQFSLGKHVMLRQFLFLKFE